MARRFDARGLMVPIALLLASEIALRLSSVRSDALAPPSEVLTALFWAIADPAVLATLTWETLSAAFSGLALGGGLGLAGGVWFGLSTRAATGANLSIELLRPLPSVALIPVVMLIFGFGYRMEIAIVAFSSFFPMLLLTQAAVRAVEPRLIDVSNLLGLTPSQRVFKIVLPAALRRVFVATRLSVGIALVVAVTVEVAANPQGLGYGMITAQQNLRPALMLALLAWIGLLGWASNAGLLRLERRWFGRMQPAAQP